MRCPNYVNQLVAAGGEFLFNGRVVNCRLSRKGVRSGYAVLGERRVAVVKGADGIWSAR